MVKIGCPRRLLPGGDVLLPDAFLLLVLGLLQHLGGETGDDVARGKGCLAAGLGGVGAAEGLDDADPVFPVFLASCHQLRQHLVAGLGAVAVAFCHGEGQLWSAVQHESAFLRVGSHKRLVSVAAHHHALSLGGSTSPDDRAHHQTVPGMAPKRAPAGDKDVLSLFAVAWGGKAKAASQLYQGGHRIAKPEGGI